jgi:hypothetical protein
LSDGSLSEAFVPAELAANFLEVVGGNVGMHLTFLVSWVEIRSLRWILFEAHGFLFAVLS